MAVLTFQTLCFALTETSLKVTLLKLFSTEILLEELEALGKYQVKDQHTLVFSALDQEKAEVKFSYLLSKYFDNLKNNLTGNKAVYIHRNSGIPLIGNVAFGIVYRNSSLIEIKTITGCNLNCIYCSLSEGLNSCKVDYVVEKDYLIEELQKLLDFAGEPMEVHVGVQGEPFLYADLLELLTELNENKQIHTISVDTNATLLTKEKVQELGKLKKLQLNISLDTLNEDLSKKMAGIAHYNVKHVKEIIEYSLEKLNRVIVAPVMVPGMNEKDMEDIIIWIKSLKKQPMLGIQNFLSYKTGKNPARQWSWEKFYAMLKDLEKKHNIKLKLYKEDFNIHKTKELPKPFLEGDVVKAVIKCPDRFTNTVVAVTKDRNISVPNCTFQKEKKISVKILRDKHNIFTGKLV